MGRRKHIISLIQAELETYCRTGRAIHLAHATRALDAICAEIAEGRPSQGGARRHVAPSQHGD